MYEVSEGTSRILHTGDWRLHMACHGIPYIPNSCASALADAVYASVTRIVDFAINEDVDTVVLGGNLLEPDCAGPSDYEFIHQQMCRLAENNIPVVWSWSHLDKRNHWPRCIEWPDNIQFIIGDTPLTIEVEMRNGSTVSFLGMEPTSSGPVRPSDYRGMQTGNLSFGIAYGEVRISEEDTACRQWLLAGQAYGQISWDNGVQAYCCGSPVGRSAADIGPHGFALLELNQKGEVEHQFINTSGVEYHRKTISTSEINSPNALLSLIGQTIRDHAWDCSILNVIQIELVDSPVIIESIPLLNTYPSFHGEVQSDFDKVGSHLIFAGLDIQSAATNRHGHEQELLGEFLFELRKLEEHGWENLQLANFSGTETDPNWCTLKEDLAGLSILRSAECLGRHLLNAIERDAA